MRLRSSGKTGNKRKTGSSPKLPDKFDAENVIKTVYVKLFLSSRDILEPISAPPATKEQIAGLCPFSSRTLEQIFCTAIEVKVEVGGGFHSIVLPQYMAMAAFQP